ncbi:hypothetical protein AU210_016379 [Fusarium oxysporum f. sp. radicis-cucumerinum]|uniref:Uncharacterized protein n=1 Tax=Fusarium oxysporum f. sp. radicis-cucumerinum TaxID=327505 RepID=A0A2H3FP52_FUSOX|nr:hypothetical protein AU210_016379 [Fusarium oxysporum f. sp. radicis-cucumerinum]
METDEIDRNDDEVFFEAVQGQPGPKKRMARQRRASRRKGPDRWCIRARNSGEKNTAFPSEYKAAHKIPVESFQKAMHREDLFIRVISRISSGKASTDGESHLQEQIEETVAKALAQTFHYMIRLGSSYGYLTAGKLLIFLRIGGDPTVLYYHMAQPENDADREDGTVDPFYTAVAQLAAFRLQTCRCSEKSNQWREAAISLPNEWPEPYAEMCGAAHGTDIIAPYTISINLAYKHNNDGVELTASYGGFFHGQRIFCVPIARFLLPEAKMYGKSTMSTLNIEGCYPARDSHVVESASMHC